MKRNYRNISSGIDTCNVTRFVYSATGEKLRVVYQPAVPSITVAIGRTRDLMPSEILYTDSTDYLLGGALTLKNGRIDMFQFDEGYCQATQYNATQDNFTFLYYDKDHLGNVRQVTKAIGSTGTVMQTMNYYPFGAQFCDGSANNNDVQPYKYNGKELDKMHGLNTYDYGARQYNPVTARWDRVDPLAEKYYNVSPYAYCHNNPVMLMDPDGMDDYYTSDGTYLGTNSAESDYIYISDDYRELKDGKYVINLNTRVGLPSSDISAEALSKIFTHIVGRMPEVDLTQIDCNQINVVKWSRDAYSNTIHVDSHYGNVMVVMIKQMRAH